MSGSSGLPAALAAFLRGAERRAFLFLWLQSGDARAAERSLAAAIRAFPGPAARMPMAEWPTRFWKLLLALPQEPGGDWPVTLGFLASMRPPVRRALLLRQVAGLDEATAAEVLGVDVQAYQQALAGACPRDADGRPDAAGWRHQAEAIQQAGRELESGQLVRLMQLREAALAGQQVAAPPEAAAPVPDARSRPARQPRGSAWLLVAIAVLGALLLGAALWWWSAAMPVAGADAPAAAAVDDLRVHDNPPVQVEPLPEGDPPPAVAVDWPAPLEESVQDPVVARLALLSWLAAGAPPSRLEQEGEPAEPSPDLLWDAGGTGADWARLDAHEQAQVHAAAVALQARDPAAQTALHARFAALNAMERRGWRLGPVLGADFVLLQPLVGFVPEDEREPLLAVLRTLTPEQRARLGALSLRTPPAERERLRRELLATPPAARTAWLDQRQQ